jgi:hypothetical protein
MSAGQMWRDVRTLLVRRQPALGYLIALAAAGVGLDLAVAAVRDAFHSFSSFSRVEFDGVVLLRGVGSLGHSSASVWLVVLLALGGGALVTGWLRACYLIALADGRYSWLAPRKMIGRLTAYSLLFDVIGLGLIGLGDNGQVGPALVILLVATPITLYADYAIVVDDVGVAEGVRRSVRVFRSRISASLLATFVLLLFLPQLAAVAFKRGFTDATHVQPTYLVAWALVGVLLQFVGDVVLLTLYRSTSLSGDGSADPSEPSRPSAPSD